MQASDTCYCTIQMTMYRENKLLAQAHILMKTHMPYYSILTRESWKLSESLSFSSSNYYYKIHLTCYVVWFVL